jgi:hypothetical protein
MSEFSSLELSEVYDLLAAYTTTYTKLISLSTTPSAEFLHTKEIIERLQQEIQQRAVNPKIEPDGPPDGLTPAIA